MIRLLRRCHLPLMLMLSFGQLLALALCRFIPAAAVRFALFPVLSMLLLMVCACVPGRARRAVLGACIAIITGAGYALLPHHAAAYAMIAGCAALLIAALSHADKRPAQASPVFYFACVAAQLLSLFLLHHADGAVRSMLLLQGAFYLWLLLFLLAFNRISLNNATLSRYRLSAGMARTGTVLTVCVFALSLLLCAMPAVASGVVWLFGALRSASIRLLLFLVNLFPAESAGGSMGGGMPMLPMGAAPEISEPSRFAILLEKIAAAISVVVVITGSILLLRLAAIALMRLACSILAHLKRYAAAVTEDYEDEITDTRTEDSERSFHMLGRHAKHMHPYPDTPAGRIRRRYAQLLARHGEWTQSSTARENLSAGAANLYERARYSEHTATAEDAKRFERET